MSRSPFHVGRDQFHLAWDPSVEPVVVVGSGDEVSFDALDASCGQITAASTAADLATLDFSRVDQVCGPVFVEGAKPGDTLQVELLEFEPGDWGWTAAIPGFGLLADEFPEAALRITSLAGGVAEFLPGIRIPLAPFCGELGVAPAGEARSTIPPTELGGNMDTRHLTAGAVLWLPVAVPGALFSLGDGHAAQGDGEVDQTGIETSLRGRLQLIVRKDMKLTWPRGDTPTHIITMGTDTSLTVATKVAVQEMVDYLVAARGLSRTDAYRLASIAADLHITQLVDGNVGVHMMVPKRIFKR